MLEPIGVCETLEQSGWKVIEVGVGNRRKEGQNRAEIFKLYAGEQ